MLQRRRLARAEEGCHREQGRSSRDVDDVIDPADTRARLIKALRMLETKREAVPGRKHGNIPL